MIPSIIKKSFGDLKLRKSRTIFTMLTITLAVASLSLFAVTPLMDEAMEDELRKANLYDVQLSTYDLELTKDELNGLRGLDNVEDLEARVFFVTRYYKGERRAQAYIVGIEDFDDQKVNRVALDSGGQPGHMELLADEGNTRNGLFSGDRVRIFTSEGVETELNITGKAHSITYPHTSFGLAVFYGNLDTVRAISNSSGYNSLALDLQKSTQSEAEETVETVRAFLLANTEFTSFSNMPEINKQSEYPGKEEFQNNSLFFYVMTFLTLFCAVFLIANTMNTMITEQRKEIAQMKAIGATRFQIIRSYMTTSVLMSAGGSLLGVILGIFISHYFLRFIASTFYGLIPPFNIHWFTVIITFLSGIIITLLAIIPALRKGLKITVREGLEGGNISSGYGIGMTDRILMGLKRMPRTIQMGIRNIARRKGRSLATILQVTLAVSMFLGIVTVGYSLSSAVVEEYDNFNIDILSQTQTEGARPLFESNRFDLESMDGVETAEPFMLIEGEMEGEAMYLFGFSHDTETFRHDRTVYRGRWFSGSEENKNASVMVLAQNMASRTGIGVGDTVEVSTPRGPWNFTVIGLTSSQMMNGFTGYVPLDSLQHAVGWENMINGFAIRTDSDDHGLIDRVSTDIEDKMLSMGYVVNNQIWYVMEEENLRMNNLMFQLMAAVGTLIVLITMIGLVSTMTMNVLERTKEIGMMRCLGSLSKHIRRVFGTEGVVLASIGWILGIPGGYAVGRFLIWMMNEIFGINFTHQFPGIYILMSLGITLVIAIVIIQFPLRRATKLKPGDALRYQ